MTASASAARAAYPRRCLEAAARGLPPGARLSVTARGGNWRVAVSAPRGARAALAELLQEALALARRDARLRARAAFAAAQAARLLEAGFPGMPADPLEELEPQVRADRLEETRRLLERARSGA